MIYNPIKRLGQSLGWYRVKQAVFGTYKNYFFNVGNAHILSNPPYKFVLARTGVISESQRQVIFSELEAHKKDLKFSAVHFYDQDVYIQFLETLIPTKTSRLHKTLDLLIEVLKKVKVPEQNVCHRCQSTETLNYTDVSGTGRLLCKQCLNQIEKEINTNAVNQKLNERNYFIAFLGATLFSIPGIIVWILVAVYIGYIASALAFVIAFLSVKGYDFMKGPQNKIRNYIVIGSNVLSIVLANYLTFTFSLMNEGFSFQDSIEIINLDPGIQKALLLQGAISLLFGIVSWIYIIANFSPEKSQIQIAKKV